MPVNEPNSITKPVDCSNNNKSLKYSQLVSFYQNISNERVKSRKYLKVEKFFQFHRDNVGNDFYALLRLLLPERERERNFYGIREVIIAKIYVDILGIDKQSQTAKSLLNCNWKLPTTSDNDDNINGTDFPNVLYKVVKSRLSITKQSNLNIDDINTYLDRLSTAKSYNDKKSIIRELSNVCDSDEQIWFVRILLGS